MTDEALYKKDQVVSLINSVLHKVSGTQSGVEGYIYNEILSLKAVIEALRNELRSVAAAEITRDHIAGATDELDAVVSMTETATNSIMTACETILADAEHLDDAMKAKIIGQATVIFEACTFQDITGQRIAKVISALKSIDAKTQDIIQIIEHHFSDVRATPAPAAAAADDKALMNGPQLPGQGISQADIDRLLQEFE